MFPKRDLAAKLGQRLPPVFFTTEELREVKAVKDPGAWAFSFLQFFKDKVAHGTISRARLQVPDASHDPL
jgi:hypothetical protein